jgi:plastocyanin
VHSIVRHGERQCRIGAVLLGGALLLSGACVQGPTDPEPSRTPLNATVRATDSFRFVEQEVHIGVGGVVVWRSESNLRHSVTPVGHQLWEPAEVEQRGVVILTVPFSEPGIYEYKCEYHEQEGMVGRVVVFE